MYLLQNKYTLFCKINTSYIKNIHCARASMKLSIFRWSIKIFNEGTLIKITKYPVNNGGIMKILRAINKNFT